MLPRTARPRPRLTSADRPVLGAGWLCGQLALAVVPQVAAPPLADLPHYQGEIEQILAPDYGLDAPAVRDFSYALLGLANQAPEQRPADIDWVGVLKAARAARLQRGELAQDLVSFDWSCAQVFLREGARADFRAWVTAAMAAATPDHPEWIWLLFSLADLERDEENWSVAKAYLGQAEQQLARATPTSAIAPRLDYARTWYHGMLGEYWLDLGLPDLAEVHLKQERELSAKLQDTLLLTSALDHELKEALAYDDCARLAEIERRMEAELWFQQQSKQVQDKMRLRVAVGLANCEAIETAPRGSASERLSALLEAGALDVHEHSWALMQLATVELDSGAIAAAREHLQALNDMLSAQGIAAPSAPNHRLALALVALQARLAQMEVDRGQRSAQELLVHLEQVERAWQAFLDAWSQAPVRGGGIAYLYLSYRHLLLQELIALSLRVHGANQGAERVLTALLKAQSLGTLARKLATSLPTCRELQDWARRVSGGALYWLPARDRSYLFAIDATGLACIELAPSHVLERAALDYARTAQRALLEPQGADAEALQVGALDLLALLLPAEASARLENWNVLALVGLEALGWVPFEVLPHPAGGWMGERLAIAHWPSLPVGWALAQRPRSVADAPAPIVASFAMPSADPSLLTRYGLQALPNDSSLQAAILAPYGSQALFFAGSAVTLENLSQVGSSALLQILTHGVYAPNRERSAGLLLASSPSCSGELWAEDVEKLAAPALVVLAACETGRALARRGDDVRGDLGAAFLVAGAQAVVLSATVLEFRTTAKILEQLHSQLTQGLGSAEALRRTRSHFSQADDLTRLQAGFLQIVGDGQELLIPTIQAESPQTIVWIAGGFVVLLLLAAISRRGRN